MTHNTIIRIVRTQNEETEGRKVNAFRPKMQCETFGKMGGLVFLAAFRKCIDTRSGTGQVLNINLK